MPKIDHWQGSRPLGDGRSGYDGLPRRVRKRCGEHQRRESRLRGRGDLLHDVRWRGVCSGQGCPAYACPAGGPGGEEGGADAGGVSDAASVGDASGADSGLCPADKPAYCRDCNGGGFCVAGACPPTTCPVRDAGTSTRDGGADAGCRINGNCPFLGQPCNGPGALGLPYPAPASPVVISGTAWCDADFNCAPYINARFCKSNGCSAGCNSDLDCAPDPANPICVTVTFPNRGSTNHCDPGCSGGGYCPEGSTCGSSHRCVATVCSRSADCPTQFDCVQSICTRRGCQNDADCPSAGYCVQGLCSTRLGACTPSFQ